MPKIKLYNNIAQIGLDQFTPDYEVNENMEDEDAILVRSANLHDIEYNANLKAIARAGAGVNNIDIDTCTKKGIAVFNTPGANSNAVKELVFAGMLLASRDIYHGIEWIQTQKENENITKDIEKQKKKYAEITPAVLDLGTEKAALLFFGKSRLVFSIRSYPILSVPQNNRRRILREANVRLLFSDNICRFLYRRQDLLRRDRRKTRGSVSHSGKTFSARYRILSIPALYPAFLPA